jgi:hypothetical protein
LFEFTLLSGSSILYDNTPSSLFVTKIWPAPALFSLVTTRKSACLGPTNLSPAQPTRTNEKQISNLLSGRKTPSPTRNGYSFLLTLLGLEGLIVKYWINGRIYTVSTVELSHPIFGGTLTSFGCFQLDDEQFLPPFLGLALVSAYIGKNALRDVQVDRLASRLRA